MDTQNTIGCTLARPSNLLNNYLVKFQTACLEDPGQMLPLPWNRCDQLDGGNDSLQLNQIIHQVFFNPCALGEVIRSVTGKTAHSVYLNNGSHMTCPPLNQKQEELS